LVAWTVQGLWIRSEMVWTYCLWVLCGVCVAELVVWEVRGFTCYGRVVSEDDGGSVSACLLVWTGVPLVFCVETEFV
jgi:hypothetical protein